MKQQYEQIKDLWYNELVEVLQNVIFNENLLSYALKSRAAYCSIHYTWVKIELSLTDIIIGLY